MTDKEMLIGLGIDDSLPTGEIKKALEKKKQNLLRKINAVYGNTAKEQELNSQLNQVEDLIIRYGVKQISESSSYAYDNSSLLSNIGKTAMVSMSQFEVATRELSQSSADGPSEDENQLIIDKASVCIANSDFDGAVEILLSRSPEQNPPAYLALGWLYGNQSCHYFDMSKSFACYKRGAELDQEMCFGELAHAYRYGLGTETDLDAAIYWYKKASFYSLNGEPEQALGEIYGSRKQYKEMFDWYQLGIYEHDSWKLQIEFAKAIINSDLGAFYTEKALAMLKSDAIMSQPDVRRGAYSALLHYYIQMEKTDSSYRANILKTAAAIADEGYVECVSTVANLYAHGYSGSVDWKKAIQYYEIALANDEEFDYTELDYARRKLRREEKAKQLESRPFTADEAEKLIAETKRSRSDTLCIPEGYTVIKFDAFAKYQGSGLFQKNFFREVVLPASLLGIEAMAFKKMKGLRRYNIPPNVFNLGHMAFYALDNKNQYVDMLVIPGDIEEIPAWCFEFNNFGTVKIEEGVERIDSEAFSFCTIDRLFLPSTLRNISIGDKSSFGSSTIRSEFRAPLSIKPLVEKQNGFHLDTAKVTYFE